MSDSGKIFIPEWGPPEQPKPIETGWVIERGKTTPFYLYVQDWFGFSWTADSLKAIRFARREDAEQIMKLTESVNCKAAEHQWGP